jgi:hypothetical protein
MVDYIKTETILASDINHQLTALSLSLLKLGKTLLTNEKAPISFNVK